MSNPKDGGPEFSPPGGDADERAKDLQVKLAGAAAERRAPERPQLNPLLYSNARMDQTQLDAVKHAKINRQRTEERGQQQKPSPAGRGNDVSRVQTSPKDISDAPRQQRNQGSQPGRYRELMNESQAQSTSNANKGQGRSGP